jgi:carboxypeptidase family protein
MVPDGRRKRGIADTRCRTFWPLLIGLLCFIALPATLVSQADTNAHGNLTGHVTDSTGAPATDAIVRLTGAAHTQWSASTNSAGRFVFSNLPVGIYVVLIRRLGYRADYSTIAVTADTSATIEVVLHMTPTQLSEVIIDAPIVLSSSGFEHRRQTGAGYYVTAEDIARHNIFDFAGVLNLSPVLRVSRGRGGPVVTSTKPTMGGGYGCASVLIDRKPLGPLVPFPEPRDIAGMETYRPNGGPAEFGGGGCALVLVWTKDYRGR